MVATSFTSSSSVYAEWRALLIACEPYASLSGWRFVKCDFMRLDGREAAGMAEAREKAMPMALEYADRVRACVTALADGIDQPPRLLTEFQACQRYVAREAVYNSMIATISAVGLTAALAEPPANADAPSDDADPFAFHDMTQPVEVIAKRLLAYTAHVESTPAAREERQQRLLQASFIVEFGLEHGLPDFRDTTSEAMLRDFLDRLGEWEGGRGSEVVRALVMDSLPAGPAGKGLRSTALEWFEAHKVPALVGGAILGGVVGVLFASAAVALASRGRSTSR